MESFLFYCREFLLGRMKNKYYKHRFSGSKEGCQSCIEFSEQRILSEYFWGNSFSKFLCIYTIKLLVFLNWIYFFLQKLLKWKFILQGSDELAIPLRKNIDILTPILVRLNTNLQSHSFILEERIKYFTFYKTFQTIHHERKKLRTIKYLSTTIILCKVVGSIRSCCLGNLLWSMWHLSCIFSFYN